MGIVSERTLEALELGDRSSGFVLELLLELSNP